MASFKIGESANERLVVEVTAIHPHESYDRWVSVHVLVNAGGFTASYPAEFTAREIRSFRDQLHSLYETLSGSASLDTCEDQLRVKIVANSRGALSLAGTAIAVHGSGNSLSFSIGLDQSYLPTTLSGLDQICDELGEDVA